MSKHEELQPIRLCKYLKCELFYFILFLAVLSNPPLFSALFSTEHKSLSKRLKKSSHQGITSLVLRKKNSSLLLHVSAEAEIV